MLRYSKTSYDKVDLTKFDVDTAVREKQIKKSVERAKRQANPNASISKKGNWVFMLLIAGVLLALFFVHGHGKIELDRLDSETIKAKERLTAAKAENVRLKTELAALATPAKIEAFAEEHGLIPVQKTQVSYVAVNIEKVAEVVGKQEEGLFAGVRKTFKGFLELFK